MCLCVCIHWVSLLTFTPGFSLSLPSLWIGFLTFCFRQQSNFTAVYNFIYISPNSLSNKGHSSRQLQGHVPTREGPCSIRACVCEYLLALCLVCAVNSKISAHTLWGISIAAETSEKMIQGSRNFESTQNTILPVDTFSHSVYLMSLNFSSRSTPPQSPIRTLQLVDWTCLQWAICLGTRWNRCPHLPEAINSKYDSFCSCTAVLLPAEYNKVELRWSWRGGGKPASGPQRVMGNYFRQIYTGSHAEWWPTVSDPRR